MNPYVLFVDDEEENLRSFRALFRRSFPILLSQTPLEAMDMIKVFPVRLVLSDQRMPGMPGLELLEWVRQYDESIIRVLLSGSIAVESKIQAKEEGLIHEWMEKPWKSCKLEQFIFKTMDLRGGS